MTNPFADQRIFMEACGQTVGRLNVEQAKLYEDLCQEERNEWRDSTPGTDDDLDAVIDQIVVLIGYALSRGYDIGGAWQEVMRSNFAKIGPDGKVNRREDGKILKPSNWSPPNLTPYLPKVCP